MVWDCAWGTGNLTRDYQFADLYCSTLQQEDLNIAKRYNRNATKFSECLFNFDKCYVELVYQQFQSCIILF